MDREIERLERRSEFLRRGSQILALIAMSVSVVMFVQQASSWDEVRSSSVGDPALEAYAVRIQRLNVALDSLKAHRVIVDSAEAAFRDSIAVRDPDSGLTLFERLAIEAISQAQVTGPRVDTLERRLSSLEKAIVGSAEQALAIPMLRRDLEDVQGGHEDDLRALERQLDRILDQNRAMIGILITLSLALFGAVFRKPSPPRDEASGRQGGGVRLAKELEG